MIKRTVNIHPTSIEERDDEDCNHQTGHNTHVEEHNVDYETQRLYEEIDDKHNSSGGYFDNNRVILDQIPGSPGK